MTDLPDFSSLAVTPRNHFRLLFFAAALQFAARLNTEAGPPAFLQRYLDEAGADTLDAAALVELADNWLANCQAWAADADLPLNRLRAAGLSAAALRLLFIAGLPEEDGRFGDLFAELQGGQREASPGLLAALAETTSAPEQPDDQADAADTQVRHLLDLGLLHVLNPEAPRGSWRLGVPAVLWDALAGYAGTTTTGRLPAGLRHTPAQVAPGLDQLALPDSLRAGLAALPALLRSGAAGTLILRGPHHNGRATLARALAREIGMGTLEITPARLQAGVPQLGLLATLLGALPLFRPDPAPGEAWSLPELPGWAGPVCVVLGRQGGIQGAGAECALTLRLPWPDASARRQLWLQHLPELHGDMETNVLTSALRLRLTSGRLVAAASLARVQAARQACCADAGGPAGRLPQPGQRGAGTDGAAGDGGRRLAASGAALPCGRGTARPGRPLPPSRAPARDGRGGDPERPVERREGAVQGRQRYRQDAGGGHPRRRTRPAVVSGRSGGGSQQIHRRDREEPGPSVRPGRGTRRDPAVRRGRRAAGQAHRGQQRA